jgi:uncharacterized Zn-finger protein
MDHPDTRLLARYALADITDEAELEALEDHLMECEQCRKRAIAVDLIGTSDPEDDTKVLLHISTEGNEVPTPLCGTDSAHVISSGLLAGLNASIVCPYCLTALQQQGGGNRQFTN